MTKKVPLAAVGLLLIATLYVAACNRGLLYRGDGRLTDVGIGAAIDRYVVDLGPIDLGKTGEYSFVLAGLPSTTMTAGFQASPALQGEKIWETKPLDAGVQMRLTRADGSVVIDETSRLPTWIWSSGATSLESFVYLAGKDEPVEMGDGLRTYRRLGVQADEGWGTYFDPRSSRRYHLAVRVWKPMTGPHYPVRVLIKGGGWK